MMTITTSSAWIRFMRFLLQACSQAWSADRVDR
jgi:hypothetical protein